MTVREWITRRTPAPPASLTQQMVAALGRDADTDEARVSEVCLAAAARGLESLVAARRFTRESALELLAIDALTTYAFEHASEAQQGEQRLAALAERGARVLGQLMPQRV